MLTFYGNVISWVYVDYLALIKVVVVDNDMIVNTLDNICFDNRAFVDSGLDCHKIDRESQSTFQF